MELKLQECNENYWLEILDIRNNDNAGFVNQTNISTELHIEYMKDNFQNYRGIFKLKPLINLSKKYLTLKVLEYILFLFLHFWFT